MDAPDLDTFPISESAWRRAASRAFGPGRFRRFLVELLAASVVTLALMFADGYQDSDVLGSGLLFTVLLVGLEAASLLFLSVVALRDQRDEARELIAALRQLPKLGIRTELIEVPEEELVLAMLRLECDEPRVEVHGCTAFADEVRGSGRPVLHEAALSLSLDPRSAGQPSLDFTERAFVHLMRFPVRGDVRPEFVTSAGSLEITDGIVYSVVVSVAAAGFPTVRRSYTMSSRLTTLPSGEMVRNADLAASPS